MLPDIALYLRNLLAGRVLHPPRLANQLQDFLLYLSYQLTLRIVYFECWPDCQHLAVYLSQLFSIRRFVPEFWTKANQLFLHIGKLVATTVLDSKRISQRQNLLFNRVSIPTEQCDHS